MKRFSSIVVALCVILFGSLPVRAETVEVPNGSFEDGVGEPASWTLSGGTGRWLSDDAAEGKRAVSITGTGSDSNYWRTGDLRLVPSAAYRLSFRARNIDGRGGTPITGPVFCNRDLGKIPSEWKQYASVFVTPQKPAAGSSWLRFGQWHLTGSVAFDDVRLAPVQPVYKEGEGVVLGEGERLAGNEYHFRAPLNSASRNHCRPLVHHQCGFNTNRWVFAADSEIVYRYEVAGRKQSAATVEVGVTWYRGGELSVSAGTDGKRWTDIGSLAAMATKRFTIPKALLPAKEVWVRLGARSKRRMGADSDPGSFQVSAYDYRATLEGAAAHLSGKTHFLAVTAADPKVQVTVRSLGEVLPGADNTVTAGIKNTTRRTLRVRGQTIVSQSGVELLCSAASLTVPPGEHMVRIPYEIPRTGRLNLRITLEGDVRFEAETDLDIADLYNASYGERLPGSSRAVGLWWASSGWKVSRARPVPEARGRAVTIRAARNEAEAAQLVVRPRKALRRFRAAAGTLRGPRGAKIPAKNVEVLRVRYVQVTRPTDSAGVAAPWPDPLPPFRGPIDIAANTNQPLWVRVMVPKDTPAGLYKGAIHLAADGYSADAPVEVVVYDFTLPDRMTCTTAFGFSAGTVWRYQKITDRRQQREVLEKYLANLSAHHISPYDPAPLDRLQVTWPGTSDWRGGRRDQAQKHVGRSSLRVEDTSATANVSSRYGESLAIPPAGFRLRFWYRTKRAGHRFIVTFGHDDAGGQWMSGRNLDMHLTGSKDWQHFERTITNFPAGAKSVRLTLWATVWKDDGSATGTVWYDDVSLQDARTGAELVRGGDFEPVSLSRLKPSFDWSAWDSAMKRGIDHYQFNSFRMRIPALGGGTFHSRHEPSLLGYGENTAEYKAAFRNYCVALQEHLREKGWLDEAFIYWFDEPDPKDYEFVMNGFRKLKEAAPEITRMLTEQVEDKLVGGPNLWCPVSHHYNHDKAEERRQAGDHFWWYVCTGPKAPYCTLFIDHPATELRVWLWQTWKRKIEGILVWSLNYWTSSAAYPDRSHPQNPYTDPMGWTSGYSTPAGVKRPWGNGDGRFIYPPEAAADATQKETVLDGPVDSIRWEMLRDGIEDYEYLAMLKRLLERKRRKIKRHEYRRFSELLDVPPSITKGMTDFTKDPAPIEARREAVARAIEKLERIQ